MSLTTRFTNGVTNNLPSNTLGNYIDTDPTKLAVFFDDFLPYTDTEWVKTAVSAGAGTSAAAQSDTAINGAVLITTAGNEDDGLWCQHSHDGGTNDLEAWRLQTGKKTWFKAKFQVSDVTESDVIVGFHIANTAPITGAPTDGVWFQSNDGDADLDIHCVKNSVDTTASAITTLVDATDIEVGFYWDGVDTIEYFVDDVKKGSLSSGTIPDDEYMAISFGCQNGEAAVKTMLVDYIFCASER